jgi:hypothetical protein
MFYGPMSEYYILTPKQCKIFQKFRIYCFVIIPISFRIFGGETFEYQKVRRFVAALGSQPHDTSVATAFLSWIGQFDHV